MTNNAETDERKRLIDSCKSRGSTPICEAWARHLNTPALDAGQTGYEELFRDCKPCPTCRGLGRVPKDQEDQLVALIPMKDGRLKPRRTLLYVGLAVSICVLLASLLIFFLWPRDITISNEISRLNPTSAYVKSDGAQTTVNFTFVDVYNVTNDNFYSATVSHLDIKAYRRDQQLATRDMNYTFSLLSIPARSTTKMPVTIHFSFIGKQYKMMALYCLDPEPYVHTLWFRIDLSANYYSIGPTQLASLTTYPVISCYPTSNTTPSATTTTTNTTAKATTHKTASTKVPTIKTSPKHNTTRKTSSSPKRTISL